MLPRTEIPPAEFYSVLQEWKRRDVLPQIEATPPSVVHSILEDEAGGTPERLMALLSPAAEPFLERMARKAQGETLRHFGRTIQLFTPIYISNYCANRCLYCGFSASNIFDRLQLSPEQLEDEAKAIAATGLRQVLVLTGDALKKATPAYIANSLEILRRYFPALGLEIYAMTEAEYAELVAAGADSLTIYQETYDEALYAGLHISGPKKDFLFRLGAPERAARAGVRAVNVAALLGLDDWRRDVFFTGLHAWWLRRRYPHLEIGVSLPRLRPCKGDENLTYTPRTVEDRHLVQALLALRIFLPEVGITISTRESASFRDQLVPLGVTRLSAGVTTAVGGHVVQDEENVPQFAISDDRSVDAVAAMLQGKGYQPVYKDWEPLLDVDMEVSSGSMPYWLTAQGGWA